jgi:mercuric ion transport protein
MTPTVELIFDSTCPHVDAAREQLRRALTRAGRRAVWVEWDRAAPDAPAYARWYASPSVLVGGRDVAGDALLDAGPGCRIYHDARGAPLVAPSTQMILTALAVAAGDT